jgi:hypothetical protein
MTFFFPDLEDASAAPVPPEEMRLIDLGVTPSGDRQRIKIRVEVTPFQMNQRPHFDVVLLDDHDQEVNDVTIIEPINRKFEFIMHLLRAETKGKYKLFARVYYPETPHEHRMDMEFDID